MSANGTEVVATNGFLLIEIDRLVYNRRNDTSESNLTQRFKVPLTEEFMSNFTRAPDQHSQETGFRCAGEI